MTLSYPVKHTSMNKPDYSGKQLGEEAQVSSGVILMFLGVSLGTLLPAVHTI